MATGVGAGVTAREFDEFYRAHARTEADGGADGIGLGLAIVAECVRHLGAAVAVESVDGEGTTFHVSMPMDGAAGSTVERGGDSV